jgi:hypothetical protein
VTTVFVAFVLFNLIKEQMAGSSAGSGNLSPREHVERIRRDRYYIGREEKNPLAEDLHQAVTFLSEELYSKDVHFLMELIQVTKSDLFFYLLVSVCVPA